MKVLHLLPLLILLFSISIIAQERPRYFDNFDTAGGVQINRPRVTAEPVSTSVRSTARSGGNPYQPSPIVKEAPAPSTPETRLVKKTAQVTMTVHDGHSQLQTVPAFNATRTIMATGKQLRSFTTGDERVDSFILASSSRYNIDPLLIYAQMHQESSFKRNAMSYKGASGLMQLMPATARRLGVTSIWDPQQNIEGGVKYMRMLLDMFGQDLELALAGYNAGEGAVMKFGRRIPPYRETQDYVKRIMARYNAISNASESRMAKRITH